MSLAKQEFTDAGRSMLGRAQNAERLTISKLVIGSGIKSVPADLWPLTALVAHKMDVTISAKRDYGQGTLLVEGSFRNDQAPSVFQLREVGVMAHIGAEADRLYSVANAFADPVDTIDPASPAVQSFKVKLIIDRIPADQLDITIGPTEAVMGENIGSDTVGPGWYKDAAGNVLRFKRVVEGTGMEIVDSPDSVYIGISTLKQNLDLYVPMNYPSPPAGALLFPSVQAAHDYLLTFIIPSDKFATIHVGPTGTGLHQLGGTIFSHPNSKQITLSGYPRVDKPISVINWLDNTASGAAIGSSWPNVTHSAGHKNLTLADVTGLSVGQIVYIGGPTGSGAGLGWTGGCKITAINSTTKVVTCDVPSQSTGAPYTAQSVVAGQRLSYYPSVLVWDDPTPGQRASKHCLSFPNGINLVENILAVNGYNAFGAVESMSLKNCQAHGAIGGGGCVTGMFYSEEFVASNCEFGMGGAGIIFCPFKTWVSGCIVGINPGAAGNALAAINPAMTNTWMNIHHCQCAMRAWYGASVHGGQFVCGNNDLGLDVAWGSVVALDVLQNAIAGHVAGSYDAWARGHSYISVKLGAGAVGLCSPAAGVSGNSNSWIDLVP